MLRRKRQVVAVSPYIYDGVIIEDYNSFSRISDSELSSVLAFAESVLSHDSILCPDGFVLDVGKIYDRGWAVVECNECWAAGIYACDPVAVLESLLYGNIESAKIKFNTWDFVKHYSLACASSTS